MFGEELRLFCANEFRGLYYLCRASDIAVVGTTFNVFSYDDVWAQNRTHFLSVAERIRAGY